MCRRGSNGSKQIPRRSAGRDIRWLVLAGCSFLWVLLFFCTASDLLTSNEVASSSLKAPALYSRGGCRGGNTTNTTKRTYDAPHEDEIRALFDRWNEALLTGDPGAVADLYYRGNHETEGGDEQESQNRPPLMLLLPTLSNEPRTDVDSVQDYFVNFLKRKPTGRIVSGQILIGPDGSWAHDAGIYEFVLHPVPSTSKSDHVGGTASFTNKSANHNGEVPRPSTNENTSRTTATTADTLEHDSPENVQESKTSIVQARYSFLYLRDEHGEWKIAHHHSSLMPESDS